MVPEPAARRYAEAAYLIAQEEGKQDEWLSGLQAIGALYADQDAQSFLINTRVPGDRKRELVEQALKGFDRNVVSLALLLLRRRRTALGPQVAQSYQEILDRQKGISHAAVTSAVALSHAEMEAVKSKLTEITGGEVVVGTQVDESIIGGLVVRIGDRLIDGSTRSRLSALKQRLAGVQS